MSFASSGRRARGVCVLAANVGCLEHYEWKGMAAGGAGGAGGSGGSAGSGGAAACVGAPHGRSATLGPYGAEEIYFGAPEPDVSLPEPHSTQGGAVSPGGRRYVQGWPDGNVLEKDA